MYNTEPEGGGSKHPPSFPLILITDTMNIQPCCDWCGKPYQHTPSVHPRGGEDRKWLCDTCALKDLPHMFNPEKLAVSSQEFLSVIAERAGEALAEHSGVTNPDDHNVSGLITDLGHFCDREGCDFRALVQAALRQWEEER